jgi:hypothetical protein
MVRVSSTRTGMSVVSPTTKSVFSLIVKRDWITYYIECQIEIFDGKNT